MRNVDELMIHKVLLNVIDKENNTLLHKFIPTILKVNQDDLKFLKNLLHLTKKNQELLFVI